MRTHFFCCKNALNDFIFPKMAYPASRGPSIFLDKPTCQERSKGLCSQGKNGYTWNIKVIRTGFFFNNHKIIFLFHQTELPMKNALSTATGFAIRTRNVKAKSNRNILSFSYLEILFTASNTQTLTSFQFARYKLNTLIRALHPGIAGLTRIVIFYFLYKQQD